MPARGQGRGRGEERLYHPDAVPEAELVLDAREGRHLARSRRARRGDPLVVFDGKGRTFRATLLSADKRGVRIHVEVPIAARRPALALTMGVSTAEGPRTDALVRSLAELGATTLIFLETERTPPGREVVRPERRARWERLAIDALKVNGCDRLMQVAGPQPFPSVLEAHPRAVVLDPNPDLPLLSVLLGPGPLEDLTFLIGPEGGFTGREIEWARAHGARQASLGAPVLRIEEAARAAAAVALCRPPSSGLS